MSPVDATAEATMKTERKTATSYDFGPGSTWERSPRGVLRAPMHLGWSGQIVLHHSVRPSGSSGIQRTMLA